MDATKEEIMDPELKILYTMMLSPYLKRAYIGDTPAVCEFPNNDGSIEYIYCLTVCVDFDDESPSVARGTAILAKRIEV